MIVKRIKASIQRKVDEWIKSVDDPELVKKLKSDVIVTGGCIPSLLQSEKVNDYDIYFKTKDTTKHVAEYYVKKFKEDPPEKCNNSSYLPEITVVDVDQEIDAKENDGKYTEQYPKPEKTGRIKIKVQSQGVIGEEEQEPEEVEVYLDQAQLEPAGEYIEKAMGVMEKTETPELKPYKPKFLSSNAITLTDKIQLIIRFYGEPSEIHKNYDFVHCTNYWTRDEGLVLKPDALASLMTKELRYVGSKYPLCSIIRTRKFINRGFKINAGQYLKMCMQLNKLDLFDINVLEDQLCGVDVAYFSQLISEMKKKDNQRVDETYLYELVDKIF